MKQKSYLQQRQRRTHEEVTRTLEANGPRSRMGKRAGRKGMFSFCLVLLVVDGVVVVAHVIDFLTKSGLVRVALPSPEACSISIGKRSGPTNRI